LNLWWIPVHGWIGSAWASLVSDGMLVLLNALALLWSWKQGLRLETKVLEEREVYS
jgi:hypothetical protein